MLPTRPFFTKIPKYCFLSSTDTATIAASILIAEKALFHMKPRGSLRATVLTEGKTLPEGSADLKC